MLSHNPHAIIIIIIIIIFVVVVLIIFYRHYHPFHPQPSNALSNYCKQEIFVDT